MQTMEEAAEALAGGRTSAAALVDEALARIADRAVRGTFTAVHADAARAQAQAIDSLRRAGASPSRFAGIPVTVKDLFDEAGRTTTAGSAVLRDAPPAAADAPAVARLRRAGFVVLGRTGMTEFAFSGLGVNPHHGTPPSPWDRETGRLPGGSSSGAAVSAAEGMGFGGLGTDTGGSCRVPAALCGVTGFKPTARRVPLAGALPLAPSLDSVGPLARTVACCAVLDSAISGDEEPAAPAPRPVAGLRLGLPRGTFLTEDMDATVAAAFTRALSRLGAAGARIELFDLPELAELPVVNATGGFAASEAWAWHRRLIAERGEGYDQRILARIKRGERMGAADYIDLVNARARIIAAVARRTAGFDAVVCPTCPVVPPPIAEVEPEADYNRLNLLLLRNTAVGNFLDRCSISLPIHRPGEAPVGLMLTGEHMADKALLAAAAGVEAALAER
ncbi:MAG: Putative amidase R03093 [uncultured Acetobacteraceae bacterium]|uniref:Amidase R03093 n=1 Tax=uncultured Acetobacteraceae bacterium TaxID=169975 RepID=A0A6J4J7G8_9PROT|nr:MAG: Putative amidase R03093 [uncultured Acetobacteraceae bacterium]